MEVSCSGWQQQVSACGGVGLGRAMLCLLCCPAGEDDIDNAPESRVEHVNIAEMVMDRLALGVYTTSSAATVWYKLEHSGRADILLVEDVEQLDKVTMMELLLSILYIFILHSER